MKRAILFFILIAVSMVSVAMERSDSLWNVGVECYAGEDYEGALRSFKALEEAGYVSPQLYYNIGNTYYKMSGYIAYSILYYERALKLDPSYKDAQSNLEFVHQFTLDKIETVPEFVLVTWFKSFRSILSSNGWAYVSLASFVIMVRRLLVFRFGRSMVLRKISFAFAILIATFILLSILFSFGLMGEMESQDGAIVVNPVSSVRSSPNTSGTSLFIIHEGTKVIVMEELGQWNKVELSDGRQGWILKRDIEII